MAYWMLFTKEAGQWVPQFGDPEQECITLEREDWIEGYAQYKRADTKIVKFERMPNNVQIEAKAKEMNS